MEPVDPLDLGADEPVEDPVPDEFGRTGAAFFGRLEDQGHRIGSVLELGEDVRCSEEDGRVSVVTARMHDPVSGGFVVEIGTLLDRERVDVRAERDTGSGVVGGGREVRDDPGAGSGFLPPDVGDVLDPEVFELTADDGGRAFFSEADLGVCVEVVADRAGLVDDRRDPVREGLVGRGAHGGILVLGVSDHAASLNSLMDSCASSRMRWISKTRAL